MVVPAALNTRVIENSGPDQRGRASSTWQFAQRGWENTA